jgi:hypothetical protein
MSCQTSWKNCAVLFDVARFRILSVVAFLVALFFTQVASRAQVQPPSSSDCPFISFNPARVVPAEYVGSRNAAKWLESGKAQPLSLAHADFDGDGVDDLVIGYALPAGKGIIAVRSGNLDAFAPQSETAWHLLAENRFISPFAQTATVFRVPVAPRFVVTARLLGQTDLVIAAQGDNAFYVLAGNGHGGFGVPRAIPVPGSIDALGAGRFGDDADKSTVVVGVGGVKPAVLLYRRSADAVSLVANYPLQGAVSSIDFDDLDGDGHPDVVMVSGGRVLILHARDLNGRPQLEKLSLPFSAIAVNSGYFTHDREWRRQMAVVDEDGVTHLVVHGDFDPRPWTKTEIKAMREALIHHQPNPFRRLRAGPVMDGWSVLESYPGVPAGIAAGHTPMLLHDRFSGLGLEDIVTINSETAEAEIISHPMMQQKNVGQQSQLVLPSAPVAAVAMPVGPNRVGLVVLSQGSVDPQILAPANTIIYTVNTTNDTPESPNAGNVCDDGTQHCSLRAAVMLADKLMLSAAVASSLNFQIMLPAGNFLLTIPYDGTLDASTGHLDVNAPATIIGQGTQQTAVIQTNPNNTPDMVFLIDAAEDSTHDYAVGMQAMTIQGGEASYGDHHLSQGGGIHWEAGVDGAGSLTLTSVNVSGNYATDSFDPAADDGGGLALYNTAAVSTPAVVTISDSTVQENYAYDAGGGIALRGAVSLTLSNSQITGNQAVGAGAEQGGGMLSAVSGNPLQDGASSPSFIHGCTIAGNMAGQSSDGLGEGGGIWTDQSLTIDQGSVIQGNSAGSSGGGIVTAVADSSDSVSITASTVTGNSATGGSGGGIEEDTTAQGGLFLQFNRVVGNTAESQPTGLANLGTGTVTATDNWWGCNTGPGASGCDSVSAGITFTPLVTVTNTANPGSVLLGSSTTLTAAFADGNPNFQNNLNAFINVPVTFDNAVNGTLSNGATATNSNAQATATLTATASPQAHANVQIDNATITATVAVMDFSISGSPSSQTVNVGTINSTFQISASAINGFSGQVCFSTPNSPLSTSFTPSDCVNSSGTVTLNINTSTAGAGNYNFTVKGSSGNISHQIQVSLTLADFTVSVSPTKQTVNENQQASYTVTVSSSNGFTGPINLSVPNNGLPAGTYRFDVNPINLSKDNPSGQAALTATETESGTWNFTVQGQLNSGSNQNAVTRSSSTLTLVVNVPPPVIYRPTQDAPYEGGTGYQNPQYAFDNNLNTAATGDVSLGGGIENEGTGETWSGFSKFSGTPKSVVLSLVWDGTCSGESCDNGISYTASNGIKGNTTDLPGTKTTEQFTLPNSIDLSTLQILGAIDVYNPYGEGGGSQNIFEIYVTVTY